MKKKSKEKTVTSSQILKEWLKENCKKGEVLEVLASPGVIVFLKTVRLDETFSYKRAK